MKSELTALVQLLMAWLEDRRAWRRWRKTL